METSSAETGSSQMIVLGYSVTTRPTRARAMPILCRCPPLNSWGYLLRWSVFSPILVMISATTSLIRPAGTRWNRLQRLAHDLLNGHPGVEGTVRVLKDDLHPLPELFEFLLLEGEDVEAVIDGPAGVRLVETDEGFADGGLAAPALPHQAQGFSCLDFEVDAIHGPDMAHHLGEDSAADGEKFSQSLNF